MRKLFFVLCWTFLLFAKNVVAEVVSYVPDNPSRALIIMHGYGGNGASMKYMTNRLKEALPNMAFYYPSAPDKAPVGGHQWFFIPIFGEEMNDKALYDKMMKDALKNVKYVHKLVDDIHRDLRIPYENIYVAGFSQGGLMALLTTLTSKHPLTVAVSFSGVPLLFSDDFSLSNIVNKPDVLLLQGTADNVIPKDSLMMSTETLRKAGIDPNIHSISGMGHQINHEALKYMIEFVE